MLYGETLPEHIFRKTINLENQKYVGKFADITLRKLFTFKPLIVNLSDFNTYRELWLIKEGYRKKRVLAIARLSYYWFWEFLVSVCASKILFQQSFDSTKYAIYFPWAIEKISCLPNPVLAIPNIEISRDRKALRKVLFVGKIDVIYHHNLIQLLNSSNIPDGIQIRIVGKDMYDLESKIQNENVKFYGFQQSLEEHYSWCDAALSIAMKPFGFVNKIQEAILYGCPVIVDELSIPAITEVYGDTPKSVYCLRQNLSNWPKEVKFYAEDRDLIMKTNGLENYKKRVLKLL